MNQIDRDRINRKTEHRYMLKRFCAGVNAVRNCSPKSLFLLVAVLALALLWYFRGAIFGYDALSVLIADMDKLVVPLLVLVTILFLFGVLVFIGTPWGSTRIRENLLRGGIANHAGEAPFLISISKPTDKKHIGNARLMVWEFDPVSIPLSTWEDHRAGIEAALGIVVDSIKYGKGRKTILVYGVPAECELPSILPWTEQTLSQEDFVLVLGESLSGPVTVNLANIPHILLGGSTGSGKSVLLKLLLMQSLHKGAEVYIADFKGGVDFSAAWHKKCRMCFDEADLLTTLEQLVAELEARKQCFVNAGCANLSEYSRVTGKKLPRLIFACDEVAELLDKTGRSKADKELLGQIENKLSTIARQGRAFGIHLILATQRPDATILPGQIRNNLDFRVCGRADNVLSQIILDNTSAADQIPKDVQGRFITGDGTVFQAYLLDEQML
ncbi:MAG: hypothetical protein LIO78_09560 [Clostridiales bacterium]|nr:hypothetical protein [Clostridiales bacterium]